MQSVVLHFASRPNHDFGAIHDRAEELLGESLDAPPPNEVQNAFALWHKSHPIAVKEGTIYPQTALLCADGQVKPDALAEFCQQSWQCRDAAELVAPSRHTLLVAELFAQSLPAIDRIRLFQGVLQAAIELTQPIALQFHHSQQIVRTQDWLDAVEEEPVLRPGTLNVRFFNISGTDGDMLMDTRGLKELDLPDLQCHFRDLDPNDLSRVLYNTAIYLVENGPVIESGHTIQGIDTGSKWTCQLEDALIPPNRTVLDLNPGAPHAAGDRSG